MSTPALCPGCDGERTQVFDVEGLDCAREAELIERHLARLPGVCAVRTLPLAGQARVVHTLDPGAVERALESIGFRAREAQAREAGGPRARVTLAAGLLTLAGFAAGLASAPAAVALYLPAVLVGGLPIARLALRRLRSGAFDMNVLMSLAIGGAMAIGEWGEASTTVVLFSAAQWLEGRSLERARRALASLDTLAPDVACVLREGREERVSTARVAPGETISVRPGERIALDGVLTEGRTEADESMLTGEPRPVLKALGDAVFAGSMNGSGAISVRVSRRADDTTLARIVRRMEDARASRAPVQGVVDRFAAIYTPAVVAVAVLLALLPALSGGDAAVWFYRALVLLVVACPCALVISTPVSIVSALTAASRRGILVKGGLHLEALARARAVVFDKTGTLTRGRPRVVAVTSAAGVAEVELLALAAAVDLRSTHALSRAVVDEAEQRGIEVRPAREVEAVPGRGIRGRVGQRQILLGSTRLMLEAGIAADPELERVRLAAEAQGRIVVGVADGATGRPLGLLVLEDVARAEARGVIAALDALGLPVFMLTGDNPKTASALAAGLGIAAFRAGLLPDQKLEQVQVIAAEHGAVLMVGDGVNDAPALAAASVGVAVGRKGADAAMETADVVLLREDLRGVPEMISLGRRTRRTIVWNLGISLAVKAAVLTLALFGYASLWAAIGADMGASLLVIANGLRLLKTPAAPGTLAQ